MALTCTECGGKLPKAHRPTCSTRRGEVWRLLRFEHPDGRYCELATNQEGMTDKVNLPPGFRFICTVPFAVAEEGMREWAEETLRQARFADSPSNSMQGRTNCWAGIGERAVEFAKEVLGNAP